MPPLPPSPTILSRTQHENSTTYIHFPWICSIVSCWVNRSIHPVQGHYHADPQDPGSNMHIIILLSSLGTECISGKQEKTMVRRPRTCFTGKLSYCMRFSEYAKFTRSPDGRKTKITPNSLANFPKPKRQASNTPVVTCHRAGSEIPHHAGGHTQSLNLIQAETFNSP